jgi:hypothetical protein
MAIISARCGAMQAISDRVKATWRSFRSPEIGFEIEDRRAPDLLRIERVGRQLVCGAAKGVHRPLRVGRHQDEAAAGRQAVGLGRSLERDPERADVVGEDVSELVGCDLADEARPPAERGHAGDRVRGRSPARLAGIAHLRVEPGRARRVEDLHRSLDQPLFGQKGVVGPGDDVDDGVADRKHVEAGVGQIAAFRTVADAA